MNLYSDTREFGFFIEVMQLAVVCMTNTTGTVLIVPAKKQPIE